MSMTVTINSIDDNSKNEKYVDSVHGNTGAFVLLAGFYDAASRHLTRHRNYN